MGNGIEGIVESFAFSKEKDKTSYSDLRPIPTALIGIRAGDEVRVVKLPINMPSDPFSEKIFRDELVGQRVLYNNYYMADGLSGKEFWVFQVYSGRFKGIRYDLELNDNW